MKNTAISQKSLIAVVVFSLSVLGLFGYWFLSNLQPKSSSGPESMPSPTLPPPQLTPAEKARIQASISASSTKSLLTEQEMAKTLQSLTAPKK